MEMANSFIAKLNSSDEIEDVLDIEFTGDLDELREVLLEYLADEDVDNWDGMRIAIVEPVFSIAAGLRVIPVDEDSDLT